MFDLFGIWHDPRPTLWNDHRDHDPWLVYDDAPSAEPRAGPYAGVGPRGYRRNDLRIREEIGECLRQDARIDASDIEVQVTDGVVTLIGTVTDREQKRLAAQVAEEVGGVRDVLNQLRRAEVVQTGY